LALSLHSSLVFGPVVSRRLGVSLGINNVPYKTCSYSCVYCQLGRTLNLTVTRKPYTDPGILVDEVARALEGADRKVDFVTFVPDGEPTLDSNIGSSIRLLKLELWVDVAVLTNASLLWMPEVREDLSNSDLVSVKVDAVSERVWRRVNRPHPSLSLDKVLDGIKKFVRDYTGAVITETMLVEGINDGEDEIKGIADFIGELSPMKAYIMVPTRPPAEPWARGAPRNKLELLRDELRSRGIAAEILDYHEPPPRGYSDLLSFVANTIRVHPLRLDYVERMAREANVEPATVIEALKQDPSVEIVEYMGYKFIVWRPKPGRSG